MFWLLYTKYFTYNLRLYVDWKGVMKTGRGYNNMDKDF